MEATVVDLDPMALGMAVLAHHLADIQAKLVQPIIRSHGKWKQAQQRHSNFFNL
jgi:hypothetical protein